MGEKGIFTAIDISALSNGKHTLILESKTDYENDEFVTEIIEIPFFKKGVALNIADWKITAFYAKIAKSIWVIFYGAQFIYKTVRGNFKQKMMNKRKYIILFGIIALLMLGYYIADSMLFDGVRPKSINENGFQATYFANDGITNKTAIIILGGGQGGDYWAQEFAKKEMMRLFSQSVYA